MSRWWRLLVLMVVVVVLLGSVPVLAQETEAPIAWLATGDSYSSGEGVVGNSGDCAQSEYAYAPIAADSFEASTQVEVAPFVFTACTGHLAADYFGVHKGSSKGTSLYDWSLEQLAGQGISTNQRYDVVTLTFGGNDIGFSEVIKDCISWIPSHWDDLREFPLDKDDCDITELGLQGRIDALTNDAAIPLDPGNTNTNGTLVDFYRSVADQHLTPSGQLFVLGYPKLFAPSSEWDGWHAGRCEGITSNDADMLGRVAEYLNAKLKVAATTADDSTGRITYLPVTDLYRNGSHELCGKGEDWINGITITRGQGTELRHLGSFHPKAQGHAAQAQHLYTQLTNPNTGILTRRLRIIHYEVIDLDPYPHRAEDPHFSGCSPGTLDGLPDGIWYGYVRSWTNEAIEFDLACMYGYEDYLIDSLRTTNNNASVRVLTWAEDAIVRDADPLAFGNDPLILSVDDVIARHAERFGSLMPSSTHPYDVLIAINGGKVTQMHLGALNFVS